MGPLKLIRVIILLVAVAHLASCGSHKSASLRDEEVVALEQQTFEKRGLFQDGDFFTRFDHPDGTTSIVYQLKHVRVRPAIASAALTKADKLNGISLRIMVVLLADGHRTRPIDGEWTKWRDGVGPVSALAVTVERKDDELSASSSTQNAKFFKIPRSPLL